MLGANDILIKPKDSDAVDTSDMNPLDRWKASPPQHEPASVTAIARAVATQLMVPVEGIEEGLQQCQDEKCQLCPHGWQQCGRIRAWKQRVQAEKDRDRAFWQRVAERKREDRKRKRFDEEQAHAWLLTHTGKLSYPEQKLRDELLRKRAKREDAQRNPIVLLDDDNDTKVAIAPVKDVPVKKKVEQETTTTLTTALPTPPPSSPAEESTQRQKATIVIDLGEEGNDEEDENEVTVKVEALSTGELDKASSNSDIIPQNDDTHPTNTDHARLGLRPFQTARKASQARMSALPSTVECYSRPHGIGGKLCHIGPG